MNGVKQNVWLMGLLLCICGTMPLWAITLEVQLISSTPEEVVIPSETGQASFKFNYTVTGTYVNYPNVGRYAVATLNFVANFPTDVLQGTASFTPTNVIVSSSHNTDTGTCEVRFTVPAAYLAYLAGDGTGANGSAVLKNLGIDIAGTLVVTELSSGDIISRSDISASSSLNVKFLPPVQLKVFKPGTQELWGQMEFDGHINYSPFYQAKDVTFNNEKLETEIRYRSTATAGQFYIKDTQLPFPTTFAAEGWKESSWVGVPTRMGFNGFATEARYDGYATVTTQQVQNGVIIQVDEQKEGAYIRQEQAIWHRKALTGQWYVYYNSSTISFDASGIPQNPNEVFKVEESYQSTYPSEMDGGILYNITGVGDKGSVLVGNSRVSNAPRGYIEVLGSFGNPQWTDPDHRKTIASSTVYTSYEFHTDLPGYILKGKLLNGADFAAYLILWEVQLTKKYMQDDSGEYWRVEVPRATSPQNKPTPESVAHAKIMDDPQQTACGTGCAACRSCFWDPVTQQSVTFDYQLGDPVNLNNLEYVEDAVDLVIKGRGINFEFRRTYRSRVNFNGPLGHNWDHAYNIRLLPHPDDRNVLILYDGHGRGDAYIKDPQGNYYAPQGHYRKIFTESDGSLTLRNSNGTVVKFHAIDFTPMTGKVMSIHDRCGNRLAFEHDANGLLTVVWDTYNRPIRFYYNERRKLIGLEDFTGRYLDYIYDSEDNLIAVLSPWVRTATGAWYYNMVVYNYSYGYSDERLNHNLIAIAAPIEAASSRQARLVNFYDADDRLIAQRWGGVNYTGLWAGGTLTYAREIQNDGVDPDNPDLPREVVTVVDRNGNVTVLFFNCNKQLIRKEERTRGLVAGEPAAYVSQFKYTAQGLLQEQILPQNNRIFYEYDETNSDVFQAGNLLAVTHFPDTSRGGDQAFHKITYAYEPVFNQVWKVTESRGNDPSYVPQNGGVTSAQRYTTEFIPDYFEGNLDTQGCDCGFTLRQLVDKYGLDLHTVSAQLNQGDLNGDGRFGICGNTVLTRLPQANLRSDSPQVLREGGTVQSSERRVSYGKFSQVAYIETPEGEVTQFFYHPENDPEGDGLGILTGSNAHGDPYDPTAGGLIKEIVSDYRHTVRYRGTATPQQVSTKFIYNPAGKIVRLTDGRGVRTDLSVNELNYVIQITRAANVSQATESGLTAYAYQSRIFYDRNNNVGRTETQYRDGNNPNLPAWIEQQYAYDLLDQLVQTTQRTSGSEVVYTRINYDANGNVREIASPMAVAGLQPGNRVLLAYDERDRPIQKTYAPGTLDERSVTCRYDLNGNKILERDAQDHDGDGQGETNTYIFDGFDRMVRAISGIGTEAMVKYDPAGNVIESQVWGKIASPNPTSNSTSGNVLLGKASALYDELARVYQREAELFVPSGVLTVRPPLLREGDLVQGDGKITAFYDYDRNSRATFVTAPSPSNALEMAQLYYDGLSRTIRAVDAQGNEVLSDFDKNSNLTQTTRIEKHPTGRVAPVTYVTTNIYDSLNRLVRSTDNLGQTRRLYYDSRNLVIKSSDAQGLLMPDPLGRYTQGNINGDGNVSHVVQDGLGRVLQTIRELRQNGQGNNPLDLSNFSNPDGLIVENRVWDKNSRLSSIADDKGNTTRYSHDNLNRTVLTTFADGTTTSAVYDKDNNLLRFTDNNGTLVYQTFDGGNRLVRREIARATGQNVQGTTLQTFAHDGLSRLTQATDNNDPSDSGDDSVITRKYGSLGQLLEELQNGKAISLNWTQGSRPLELIYPNNRKLSYTYDTLGRIKTIASNTGASPIAGFDYSGSRLIERLYANNTKLSMLNDAGNADTGYDALGRLTQLRHLTSTNSLIAGFQFGYNRENMKTYSEDLAQAGQSEVYKYDSVYRIADFQRGVLTAAKDAVAGTPTQTQNWQLDGVGNWAMTAVDGTPQTQTVNTMNEYTSFAGIANTHDLNGNLTDDGDKLLVYDFANRLIAVRKKSDSSQIARYTYDAFNRRIAKQFIRTRQITTPGGGSEYTTDGNTIALYHFNEESGQVQDSSGNGNHAQPPNTLIQGVDGLFATKAVAFHGTAIKVPASPSLDSITNKLTLEAFIYLDSPNAKGGIIERQSSFVLEVLPDMHAGFTLFTTNGNRTVKTSVSSDAILPTGKWTHIAAVYDGSKIMLYVDTVLQAQTATITGNVKLTATHLQLGGIGFMGKLEEARISNTARTSFGGSGGGGTTTVRETVLRSIYYAGWRLIEERERVAPEGQALGAEILTRQFVDGSSIDEHLTQDVYDAQGNTIAQTMYYHESARGDTVAVTDGSGNVTLRIAYSAYGQAYKIGANGALEALTDGDSIAYTFQGRQLDEETGLLYFRARYYSASQGRFISRDPIGYGGGLGLHEFVNSSPYRFSDPLGLLTEDEMIQKLTELKNAVLERTSTLQNLQLGLAKIKWEGKFFDADRMQERGEREFLLSSFLPISSLVQSFLKVQNLYPADSIDEKDKFKLDPKIIEILSKGNVKTSNMPLGEGTIIIPENFNMEVKGLGLEIKSPIIFQLINFANGGFNPNKQTTIEFSEGISGIASPYTISMDFQNNFVKATGTGFTGTLGKWGGLLNQEIGFYDDLKTVLEYYKGFDNSKLSQERQKQIEDLICSIEQSMKYKPSQEYNKKFGRRK